MNRLALASVICAGLGFCVLFVGGLLGIILGVLGFRRARETKSGRAMAITGISVGVISLITSGTFIRNGLIAAKAVNAEVQGIRDANEVAENYMTNLSHGNVDAAMADTSGFTRSQVLSDSTALEPLGAFVNTTPSAIASKNNIANLSGIATFAMGNKTYTITLTKIGANWKVTTLTFR